MTDDNLRNRYRRNFTAERIGPARLNKQVNTASSAPRASDYRADAKPLGLGSLRFKFLKKMPQSPLLIGMLIGVSAAAAGWLAFGGTNSNKTAPPKPQAQSSPVSQKKTVSTNNTSTLGASTNPASKPAPTPSYTSSLPTGFYLNNDAQNLGNGVITYSINDSNGNTYSVVQEPLPANSNATVFAQKLTDTETFTAPVGNAVIGDSGSELLAGVNAPNNTWIIIEAPNTSLRPQLEELVRSLRS